MNEINDTNISLWVEKFLDGETSCAEERELYRYFAQKHLPAEAEPYREMFKWYSSLLAGEAAESLDGAAHESDTKGNSKVRILRLRPWQWVSVAASIVLLFALGAIFRPSTAALSDEYMAYQGSYIIRDGKKITDLSIVVPEIQRAEQMLNDRVSEVDRSFDEMNQAMINSVSSNLDMSNPSIREAVETALEY